LETGPIKRGKFKVRANGLSRGKSENLGGKMWEGGRGNLSGAEGKERDL